MTGDLAIWGRRLAEPFGRREDEGLTGTLRFICWTFLAAALATLLVSLTLLPERPEVVGLSILTVTLFLLVFALALVERGRVRVAGGVIVGVAWVATTAGLVMAGGLRTPGFSFYTVGILAAGLLLGTRAAVLVALLTAATSGGIGWLEFNGLLPEPVILYAGVANVWWHELVLFASTAGLVHISVGRIRDALADAERSETTLAERNRELLRTLEEKQRAQEAETRLLLAMNQTEEAIVLFDTNARILYGNRALGALLNRGVEEIVGCGAEELLPTRNTRVRREVLERLAAGESWRGRMGSARADLPEQKVDGVFVPVTDPGGRVFGYVGVLRDVSREAALESRLRQAQKLEALGRLAGGVAHDFNNLLVVIRGYAKILERGGVGDHELHEAAEQITQAADQAAKLTSQLLAFGRRRPQRIQPVDLHEFLGSAVDMLQRLVPDNVLIAFEPAERLPNVSVDPAHVHQLLLNLVANARDAMPQGGEVTLRTRCRADEPRVELAVSDTGMGMDEATLERIFEPFFSTKGEAGTGLGLASVYGNVERCGGTIEVESAPGKGATFRILLPSTDAPTRDGSSGVCEPLACGSGRLLVVEDQPLVRKLVERVLCRAGFDVVTAPDGREALARVEEGESDIDLLLTDVMMPHLDGPGLVRALRERSPELRVLYTSGYSPEDVETLTRQDPRSCFLQKPFTDEGLLEQIGSLLGPASGSS